MSILSEQKVDIVITHTSPSFCELLSKEGIAKWTCNDKTLISDIQQEREVMNSLKLWKNISSMSLIGVTDIFIKAGILLLMVHCSRCWILWSFMSWNNFGLKRELQNHARAEGISADIEDKIKGKIRNRQITMHCPFYHPVQKYHNQKYLWYFCTKITIKLLECIKKERILKVSRTKVPQLKIFVVLLYKN